MKHEFGYVAMLGLILLGLSLFASPANAMDMPPGNVPGHGYGQMCEGDKGEFFITADGNTPYVSFHMRGNTTMMGEYRIKFEKLEFFNDTDHDGKLTAADAITNQVELATLTWTTGYLIQSSTDIQVTLNTSTANLGQMKFVFHFQNTTNNDTSNLLKFDWDVVNMLDNAQTYNGGDHVALKVQFFIDIEGDSMMQPLKFLNGTGAYNNSILCSRSTDESQAEAMVSWAEKAAINGVEMDHACGGNGLDNSSEAEDNVEVIRFAFPKFQNLSFDPTVGIPTAAGIPGFPVEILVSGVLLTGGLFAFFLNRKLRNK